MFTELKQKSCWQNLQNNYIETKRSCLSVLSIPEFRIYISGQIPSIAGTGMRAVALSWLIYRITNSVMILSAIGAITAFSMFFFSYLGGSFADKFDRRKYLLVIESLWFLQSLALIAMQLFNAFSTMLVLILCLIGGILVALEFPARTVFTVDLVGRENLVRGRAIFAAFYHSSLAIGSGIAALLTWQFPINGELFCFISNAIAFLFSMTTLCKIKSKSTQEINTESKMIENTKVNLYQCLKFAWNNKLIWLSFAQTTILILFSVRIRILFPVFAEDVMHTGAFGHGLLVTTWSIGQVTGALLTIVFGTPSKLIKWASWALLTTPLAIVIFSTDNLYISAIGAMFTAFLIHAHVSMCQSILQDQSPNHLQGRLFALRAMLVSSIDFGATFIAAAAVNMYGTQYTIYTCAGMCLICTLWCLRAKVWQQEVYPKHHPTSIRQGG